MLFAGLAALTLAAAFLLPGFLIQMVADQRREYERPQNPFELTLRALLWSLVVQLAFFPWTAKVARDVGEPETWFDHVHQIVPYLIVALLLAPLVLGYVLGEIADRLDRRAPNPPRLLARALGAEAGEAASWPRALERLSHGAWVIAHTKEGETVGGFFGAGSLAPLRPDWRDIFIESQWTFDGDGHPVEALTPPRSLWIDRAAIESLTIIPFTASERQG